MEKKQRYAYDITTLCYRVPPNELLSKLTDNFTIYFWKIHFNTISIPISQLVNSFRFVPVLN